YRDERAAGGGGHRGHPDQRERAGDGARRAEVHVLPDPARSRVIRKVRREGSGGKGQAGRAREGVRASSSSSGSSRRSGNSERSGTGACASLGTPASSSSDVRGARRTAHTVVPHSSWRTPHPSERVSTMPRPRPPSEDRVPGPRRGSVMAPPSLT